VPTGETGATGAAGTNGVSAFTALTADATLVSGVRYDLTVTNSDWVSVGQIVYVTDAGYYSVVSKASSTNIRVDDLLYPGNDPAHLLNGNNVSTAGLRGATGSTGAAGTNGTNGTNGVNGVNAYTTINDVVTSPMVNIYTVPTADSSWMSIGQMVYVQGAGYYEVYDRTVSTKVSLEDKLYAGNNPAGLIVGATISPAGLQGSTGPTGATGADGRVYETTDGNLTPAEAAGAYEFLMRNPDHTGYTFINIKQLKDLLNSIE
jgi:hypothetical protein